jgi:hypothetical protein
LLTLGLAAASAPHLAAQLPAGGLVVVITSPTDGSTVGGTIAVTASAGGVGGLTVRSVRFTLDGVNLGEEDTAAPYAISWNTRTAGNGSHTLVAVARDAFGIAYSSSPVTVTVFNDLTPPAVAMTAPAAGAMLSGATTVAASASDNVGVAGVQFRLDGVNLGAEDVAAPYSAAWNTASAGDGSHTLTAVARDAAGNVTTSAGVTVTVDNTRPSVGVTAPASGGIVVGTQVVTADASDNVAVSGVQFRLDGANLGAEDTTAPYSVPWNTATAGDGSHTLTAVARDPAGNVVVSAPVSVTVDNGIPTIAMSSPASGATVAGTATVSATATDGGTGIAGVQFRLDGANLGVEDTTAPYSVAWDTRTAANGSHSLTAVARDAAGNTATAAAISVTVSNVTETTVRVEDTSASIAYAGAWSLGNTAKPWSGGTAALATGGPSATGDPTRATLTFTGTAVKWIGFRGPQTGIAKVYLDGVLMTTVDTYAAAEVLEAVLYSATGLASATHTLAIEATGTRNPSSSDIFVVVDAFDVTSASGGGPDTTPPAVAMTTPTAGSTVSATIAVAANASDAGGVAGVQFYLDGAILQAEDTSAPYAIDWDTRTTGDGTHTLTAVARDAAGNTATSAAVVVTVSNAAPPPASTMTRFENTDPSVTYTPGSAASAPPNWWHGSRSRGWSGETSAFNRSDGAQATFAFTGTSVTWIGFRADWAGIGRVYVDGAFAGEIDLYSPTEQSQARVFTASGLQPGPHTLIVESTGRRNPSATDNAVVVDAFDVGPAMPPPVAGTRIENTSAAMTFTAGWTQPGGNAAWSGGTAMASSTTGARATVAFTGTTVSLIGLRGPDTGIARVFLDGSFHSNIDTYSPTEIQAVVFADTNLAPGSHEMTIEVTGLKNAAATGHRIVVDAFDVRTRFEDVDPALTYTGGWVAQNFDEAWSGTSANYGSGSAVLSAAAGSRADFRFTGTSVSWIGFRGPQTGIARVYLDGAFAAEVDTYSAAKQVRVPLFSAGGLAPGQHTLTVEVTGLKNAASTNAFVVVDAFDVTLPSPAPVVRRFQQTDAIYPAGVWEQSTTNFLYTGGTVAFSTTPGARAEFSFTGTEIRWIGQRGFGTGIARVYLDGVAVADVDTYAPNQEEFQAVMFRATGLSPGTHTIAIEVTGQKNAASSGTRVLVDGFDVMQ